MLVAAYFGCCANGLGEIVDLQQYYMQENGNEKFGARHHEPKWMLYNLKQDQASILEYNSPQELRSRDFINLSVDVPKRVLGYVADLFGHMRAHLILEDGRRWLQLLKYIFRTLST